MGKSHDLATGSNFSSKGIDDNADATSITIDNNETVMVGKTVSDGAIAGHELRPSSFAIHTRSGGAALGVRRITDNGDIAFFENANGAVGKIGTPYDNELYVEATGANSSGLLFTSGNTIQPRKNSAADNGNIDVGTSGNRFKDIHLAGAVKTTSAQFNSGGTYTADVYTDRNDNYFEGYRSCLGFFAPGAGQPYVHLKTNLPDNTNKMVKFECVGFEYSGGNTHNSVTFYTYHATNSPYNPTFANWGAGGTNGIVNYYYSSDNYVVIVLKFNGSYSGGFLYTQSGRSHMWYNPDIITASNSGNNSGVF